MSNYERMSEDTDDSGPSVLSGRSNELPGSTMNDTMAIAGTQGQTVEVRRPGTNRIEDYNKKVSVFCGVIQVFIGVTAMSFGVSEFIVPGLSMRPFLGLIEGVLFILNGSFGIASGLTKHRCQIITCMVLSIVSIIFATGIIFVGLFSAIHFPPSSKRGSIAIAMTLLASLECVVCIVQSAMCCKVTCCGAPPPAEVRVLYVPYAQGQPSKEGGNVTVIDTQNIHAVPPT